MSHVACVWACHPQPHWDGKLCTDARHFGLKSEDKYLQACVQPRTWGHSKHTAVWTQSHCSSHTHRYFCTILIHILLSFITQMSSMYSMPSFLLFTDTQIHSIFLSSFRFLFFTFFSSTRTNLFGNFLHPILILTQKFKLFQKHLQTLPEALQGM